MNNRKLLNRCGVLGLSMITILTYPREQGHFTSTPTAPLASLAAGVTPTAPTAPTTRTTPTTTTMRITRATPTVGGAVAPAAAAAGAAPSSGAARGSLGVAPPTAGGPVVYVCPMDCYVATQPGVSPISHLKLEPMALANADPQRDEATGQVIVHPVYAMVDGRPYAFASEANAARMLKHPLDYLHLAEDRAKARADYAEAAFARRLSAG